MDLLKEVGRTICDARTVEIQERITVTPQKDGSFEGGSFRVLLGPNGEYRLETERNVIVHDGRYVAFWVPADKPGGPKYDISVVNTRQYQPRWGPHWRYPGDLVMAAGMGRACDPITLYMRLLGTGWLKQLSIICRVLEDAVERCDDHACRKTTTEWNYGGRITFWIDISRIVFHKMTITEKDGSSMNVVFELTRINSEFKKEQFVIPREVFDSSKEQSESGFEPRE